MPGRGFSSDPASLKARCRSLPEPTMRVILVGPLEERRRLRARLPGDIDIVGEAADFHAARTLQHEVGADALVMPAQALGEVETEVVEERLTARELEVLSLMAEGLSNKLIADRLGISDQTVKFHVASVCGKLDALNRTDAVRRGLQRGLIAL
jgi:DNA-binding CsgD family transcriptional regulator